jgi:hypothetical protein
MLLFVAGLLGFLEYSYSPSFDPAPLILGVSFLCLPFLVALEGLYVFFGRIRKRELPLMFAFGIAATVVSVFVAATLMTAGPCALGVSGGGFPLPWYITFTQYAGPNYPCILFFDRTSYWQMFAIFSFLFDTIFYTGLAMSRDEIYKWTKGPAWRSQSILPDSPEGTP